jgi:hypothetical protein
MVNAPPLLLATTINWGSVTPLLLAVVATILATIQVRSHNQAVVTSLAAASAGLTAILRQLPPDRAALGVGGGTVTTATAAYLPLTSLPRWKQTSAILPDGVLDPGAYNDCGETCIAGVVAAVHGVPVSPGSVRANSGGVSRSGLTSAHDLVSMLGYYNCASSAVPVPAEELRSRLSQWTAQGFPTVVLGTWPRPGRALHWMSTVGCSESWQAINPWTGSMEILDWDTVIRTYAGYVVLIGGHLHYDMAYREIPH